MTEAILFILDKFRENPLSGSEVKAVHTITHRQNYTFHAGDQFHLCVIVIPLSLLNQTEDSHEI
jgi:hypothetical protein